MLYITCCRSWSLSGKSKIDTIHFRVAIKPDDMKKIKLEDLKQGDIIRAVIPKNGEHTLIVLNDYAPDIHIQCLNACSFSSRPSRKKDARVIEITGCEIPSELFKVKKEKSFLRIDEIVCLKKYLYRDYIMNLKAYPDLWKKICEEISLNTASVSIELDGLCECECLPGQVQPFDCILEINQLDPIIINKYKKYGKVTSCSCCYRIIYLGERVIECSYCQDNTMVYIHDFNKNKTFICDVD